MVHSGSADGLPDVAAAFGALAAKPVFPAVLLSTDRLRLRPYTEADVEAHLAVFDHAAAERWSDAPHPYPRDLAVTWCTSTAQRIRTSGTGICWAVEERATGRLVGMTGLYRTDWDNRVTDVSANGAACALGRGFATQALRVIAHWVLVHQRFNRVQITSAVGNRAPALVALAAGFVREGVLRNVDTHRTGQRDMVMHSLIPRDLDGAPVPDYSIRYAGDAQPAIA